MKKINLKSCSLFILLIIMLTSCSTQNIVKINNAVVNVDVVDDEISRNKGLMFVESMPENQGMLFVWEDEVPRTFWMKNTLIPLDIIFINKDYTIVNILRAYPCEQDPCELYPSISPAKYVLEVNAGWAEKNNVTIGEKIILK